MTNTKWADAFRKKPAVVAAAPVVAPAGVSLTDTALNRLRAGAVNPRAKWAAKMYPK